MAGIFFSLAQHLRNQHAEEAAHPSSASTPTSPQPGRFTRMLTQSAKHMIATDSARSLVNLDYAQRLCQPAREQAHDQAPHGTETDHAGPAHGAAPPPPETGDPSYGHAVIRDIADHLQRAVTEALKTFEAQMLGIGAQAPAAAHGGQRPGAPSNVSPHPQTDGHAPPSVADDDAAPLRDDETQAPPAPPPRPAQRRNDTHRIVQQWAENAGDATGPTRRHGSGTSSVTDDAERDAIDADHDSDTTSDDGRTRDREGRVPADPPGDDVNGADHALNNILGLDAAHTNVDNAKAATNLMAKGRDQAVHLTR